MGNLFYKMADDKNSRVKKAYDQERRQRERYLAEELERMGEREPPLDDQGLEDIESELESQEFPVTGEEVVEAVGDQVVESVDGTYSVDELVPETSNEAFGTVEEFRKRVQKPKIAVAMKTIIEASGSLQDMEVSGSQYKAYEKTLHSLKNIDADDDDEGIKVVTDWIVDRIHEKRKLPSSRTVRKRAEKFCRGEGYEIRDDEWLGA